MNNLASLSPKEKSAFTAIELVKELAPQKTDIIGLGTGSTVAPFIRFLAKAFNSGEIIPRPVCTSSIATMDLCQTLGLHILPAIPANGLRLVVDGADEIDEKSKAIIKGGGAATLAEKDLARAALRNNGEFIIIADESKLSNQIGTVFKYGVPVHVRPEARLIALQQLEVEFKAQAILRNAIVPLDLGQDLVILNGKSGCYGNLFTRENDFIIDVRFNGAEIPTDFNERALKLTGVVGTGLFNLSDAPTRVIIAKNTETIISNW